MWINLYCIFFAAITVSLAQDGPKLAIMPADSEIRRDLGTAGFFTCRAVQQSELISDVVWTDPSGAEVPDELGRVYSGATMVGKGRELFITNITEQDSGDYTCKARYGNQEVTAKFSLLVYTSIRWVDAPRQQHPVTGTNATINCVVEADPPAVVQWLYSSGEYIQKTDRYTPLEEGHLHIENISSEDDGELVCRAKVLAEGEMDERRITVEVYSRPEISDPKPDTPVEIVESKKGAIRCRASGKPAPTLRWLGPTGTDAAQVPGLSVDGEGTLRFEPASREMAGRYRCTATNDVESVHTSVSVVVIVPPEIVSYENVTSAESGTTKLVCRASGSPLPSVLVSRAGSTDGPPAGDRTQMRQFPEGDLQVAELEIRNLSRADAGLYDCAASNVGGGASRPARLTVQYRPLLSGPPSGDVHTWSGQAAALACRVDAEPAASVRWMFRGAEARGERTQRGDTNVLTVTPTDASDYGVYRCTASNSLGSRSLNIALLRATEPSTISGAAIQELWPTSVEFSIPPPANDGGLPITEYWAQYALLGQHWAESNIAKWPAEGPFLLEGLTAEQTYLFRFAAVNSVGPGGWSEELQETLPEISAPQPPLLVSADGAPVAEQTGPDVIIASDQPHSYEARWADGGDNGAVIDRYQVTFYKVIFNRNAWHKVPSTKRTSVVLPPGPLAFRLTDLKADSHYRLELRAHNRVGNSEPAQLIVRTAPGETPVTAPPPARASSLVVGVVVAALLALLLLCDLTCYAVNNRGLTHMLCSRARGTAGGAKLSEEAASEKEPLQENGNGNKSSPAPPEANGERDDEEELNIDKARLDAAKDSAV